MNARHRYIEFGCGLGYVARWAATQASHVTAVDLSDEHLSEARQLAEGMALRNIEFINASIYDHQLPPASFDYAYARWLLVHLNRPVDAMRKIFEALKPGGFLVSEEVDVSEVYTEPPSAAYHEYRDLAMLAGQKRGVDYAGGRRLHKWASAAGFEIVSVDAYQPHYLSGPQKSFWSWTFLETAPTLVREQTLTEDRVRQLAEGMKTADEDPTVLIGHCRNHQLIARKPRHGSAS